MPIENVEGGPSPRPLHHLASDLPFVGASDGHLLSVNGIVAGDYELHVAFDDLAAAEKAEGSAGSA